jgi:hypothetical protein
MIRRKIRKLQKQLRDADPEQRRKIAQEINLLLLQIVKVPTTRRDRSIDS